MVLVHVRVNELDDVRTHRCRHDDGEGRFATFGTLKGEDGY